MSPDPTPRPDEQKDTERAIIERALSGMSGPELIDLRTTAHRLKHLPFTRLIEALFSQDAARGEDRVEGGDRGQVHNFAGEAGGHCQSNFVRDLFRQIEEALATNTRRE